MRMFLIIIDIDKTGILYRDLVSYRTVFMAF